MPITVLVVIVGLMLIAAIVWNGRARRGTAGNADGSSWSGGGDSGCDSGSDGGGGCDGGGGDGGGGGGD